MIGKINWSPDKKALRKFGITLLVGFGIIASVLFFFGSRTVASWVAGIGGAVGLLAIVAPALARPFYIVWMGFGFVMGTIVSSVILSIIFFLILTPIGLFMRLLKRDPLRLSKKSTGTYWEDHPALEDKNYYERLS